jgi:hypothetical protein
MKRLSLVLAVPLICMGLTSCSGAPAPQATVTVTQAAPTVEPTTESVPSSSASNIEVAFLNFVRQKDPLLNAQEDDTLLNWGRGICTRMDDGQSFTRAAIVLYSDGDMTLDSAAKFGGASVAAFCPEHSKDISE